MEEQLNECEFQSVSFLKAFLVAVRAEEAEPIGVTCGNGTKIKVDEKRYLGGRLLIFDENHVYFSAMYSQENIGLSGWTYTVYRVTPTPELLNTYQSFLTDTSEEPLIHTLLKFTALEYSHLLREPQVLISQITFVIALLAISLLHRQRRKLLQ